MEQPLSTLIFKGSILEAIGEAKRQKKLFVVYISGDNQESRNLEASTWMDSRVIDSVLKFCVLLHISEGSPDAANFSAIYPQKSVPSVTALGYNGIRLWQQEGYFTADILASSIEKAWLSLHVQETTARFLTATLASNNHSPSGSTNNVLTGEGSSSRENLPSEIANAENVSAGARPLENSATLEQDIAPKFAIMEAKPKTFEEASPGSPMTNEDTYIVDTANALLSPSVRDLSRDEDESHIQKDNYGQEDALLEAKKEVSEELSNKENRGLQEAKDTVSWEISPALNKATKVIQVAKDGICEETSGEASDRLGANHRVESVVDKPDVSDSGSKSNDVCLNVRLPDASSLQVKFSVFDTLRMVKDYVDQNHPIDFGSYAFAIPYPRKVFSNQEMDQTLSDLGLSNRQTLILVLHHQAHSYLKGGLSSHSQISNGTGSSNGSEGYWPYIRRMISSLNPFSYLSGGSNSPVTVQESQNSTRQYSPNPSLGNNPRDQGASAGMQSSNKTGTAAERRNNSSRLQASSRFGSNIHTLKHDEDDNRFSDRNVFWNGNSTQFGGDNNEK